MAEIICSLVKDTSDPVWEQCLKLRHTTEIVCAPSFDVACICILNGLIEDDIEQRHDLFPASKASLSVSLSSTNNELWTIFIDEGLDDALRK